MKETVGNHHTFKNILGLILFLSIRKQMKIYSLEEPCINKRLFLLSLHMTTDTTSGADPGFQVRGGGGGALKIIAPSGGRRENFRGISCEKSLFYAKKSYFLQLRRVARKLLGYFV